MSEENDAIWFCKKEELRESGSENLNFLFKQGKFYIMDNHLAAAWCWLKSTNTTNSYGLFHIDRHYDFLDTTRVGFIDENSHLFNGNISDYVNVKDEDSKFARFDNYIDLFLKLRPNSVVDYFLATHNDGFLPDYINAYEPNILDLHSNIAYWISESNAEKWIVNIDLDYFFTDTKDQREEFNFLTKEYIINICKEIELVMDKIDVITIATSPEFCNGWESSFEVLKIFTDYFSIDFNI